MAAEKNNVCFIDMFYCFIGMFPNYGVGLVICLCLLYCCDLNEVEDTAYNFLEKMLNNVEFSIM